MGTRQGHDHGQQSQDLASVALQNDLEGGQNKRGYNSNSMSSDHDVYDGRIAKNAIVVRTETFSQ